LAYNRNIQQSVLVVELSTGQMVEDVRLATKDRVPVQFYGRVGGQVPSVKEIVEIAMNKAIKASAMGCVLAQRAQ
jgi:pyruvate/2-oxoacid:ferredoxin oxidoreductase alpha subunit